MQTALVAILLKMITSHIPIYTRNVCALAREIAKDTNQHMARFGSSECEFGADWAAAFREVREITSGTLQRNGAPACACYMQAYCLLAHLCLPTTCFLPPVP